MDDPMRVEHLKLISNVIDRMGRNSFLLKAWTVVIVGAIFALATKQVDDRFYLVGLLPAIAFWGLDGYYLWQEKYFRALYDAVRNDKHDVEKHGPFSMNTQPYDDVVVWWGRVCISRTVFGFYAPIVLAVVLVNRLA